MYLIDGKKKMGGGWGGGGTDTTNPDFHSMGYFHGWEATDAKFLWASSWRKKLLWDQNLCLHSFFSLYVPLESSQKLVENWKKTLPFRNHFAWVYNWTFFFLFYSKIHFIFQVCVSSGTPIFCPLAYLYSPRMLEGIDIQS